MNWEALGAIGELTGAFAVVVSLIYVGVQVRHSAGAVRSAAANDASVAMQNWYLEMGSNRQAGDIWFNAIRYRHRLYRGDDLKRLISSWRGSSEALEKRDEPTSPESKSGRYRSAGGSP